MAMKHRVCVRVTQSDGIKRDVLEARERKLHKRFLRFLFGAEMNVLIISPGKTVNAIEIKEVQEGCETSLAK